MCLGLSLINYDKSSLMPRVVLRRCSHLLLRCAAPVDGVRCCRITLLSHNSFSYWSTLLFFSLRHFGHLSRNSIKTRRNSIN